MEVSETEIPGVLLIAPKIYRDNRGAFWETWNERTFVPAGLPKTWVQDNCSVSAKNVIRGIHYQLVQPQAKLIRVAHGAVLDIAVDLRRGSKTFGKFVAAELSAENGRMLFIPVGFGHGFAVLSEQAVLTYKVTDYYCPGGERTIRWDDPDIAVPWPVAPQDAVLSQKDCMGMALRDAEVF